MNSVFLVFFLSIQQDKRTMEPSSLSSSSAPAPPLMSVEIGFPGESKHYSYTKDQLQNQPVADSQEELQRRSDYGSQQAAYSYEYTGKHDHGVLPPIQGGHYADLLTACQKAKQDTEKLLGPLAQQEIQKKEDHSADKQRPEQEADEEVGSDSEESRNSLDREIESMDTSAHDEIQEASANKVSEEVIIQVRKETVISVMSVFLGWRRNLG